MHSNRGGLFTAATAVGLAASIALAGCGVQPGAQDTAAGSASRETAELTSTSASRGALEAPFAYPLQAPLPQLAGAKRTPGPLATFTFPDGRISFRYPDSWTVRTANPPAGLAGIEAVVADSSGTDLVTLAEGVTAGCTGGPVSRRVLDQADVPGLTATRNADAAFGFVVESSVAGDAYYMGLTDSRSLKEGENVSSWCNLVATDAGGLFTRVVFDEPAFPTMGAARAWMATDGYAQIKALLVSLQSR